MSEKKPKGNKAINTIVSGINATVSQLYRNTYFTTDSNKRLLDTVKKDMDSTIDKLVASNMDMNGGTNISKLINRARVKDVSNNKDVVSAIEDVFNDKGMMDSILSTYMENRYIRDLDLEIDTICKYMPQLDDALEISKDNVLSADDFTKDFINVRSMTKIGTDATLLARTDVIKKEYGLLDLIETVYDNTAKYGEQFLYILPYTKAFNAMLQIKNSTTVSDKKPDIKLENGVYISEAAFKLDETTTKNLAESVITKSPEEPANGIGSFEFIFENSNCINSLILEETKAKNGKMQKFDKTIDEDVIEFDSFDTDRTSNDGLVDQAKQPKIKANGCIVRKLPREHVIPVYIDELCLGYYYIESSRPDTFEYVESLHDPMASLKRSQYANKENDAKNDGMLKNLSKSISSAIDAKFINANQDLKKEIYLILKHNSLANQAETTQFKVTFIPPEDMIHFYFKKDAKTNRGISDLAKALLPAKLYSSLYVSDSIGILTRSQDKRAYFVKQYVDTNISGVLLNTINQIKKSNFGMREINNINSIMGIQGRYSDYVIPISQSGEKPIEFEIIPGQDINPKTELMESLQNIAINSTGVPVELVNNQQPVDYATRLVMTNTRFLRRTIKRQSKFQDLISYTFSRIYNAHYDETETFEVLLPPPSHLNITNMGDLFTNTSQLCDGIVDLEAGQAEESQLYKDILKKHLMRYHLSTFIRWDNIDKMKEMARMEASINEKKTD